MARALPHPAWLAGALLAELPVLGHRPLVRDEVISTEAGQKTLGALWHALGQLDAPLGLYYLLLHPWLQVSTSATWVRLPSLLGMLAAVAVLTVTATRLGGRRAGTLTALVLLANPATWAFAAFARPYGLAVAAAAVTLHVVLAAPRRAVLLGVTALLVLYLQGLFVLLLVAEGVLVLRRRQWRLVAALTVAGVGWLPLAVETSQQHVMTSWIPLTAPGPLASQIHELFGDDTVLSAAALVTWLALLAWTVRGGRPLEVLLLGVVPAAALVALGVFLHVLGGRYALYVLLTTALALGLALADRQRLPVVVPVVLVLLAVASLGWEATLSFRQEDLPAAAAWLAAHDRPGDVLLFAPDHSRAGFLQAEDRTSGLDAADVALLPVADRRTVGSFYLPERSASEIRDAVAGAERVWVLGYPGDDWRPTPNPSGDVAASTLKSWPVVSDRAFGQFHVRLLVRPG